MVILTKAPEPAVPAGGFDFGELHASLLAEWMAQFKAGPGVGDYSYTPGGPTSLYGTTDMVYARYLTGHWDLTEADKDAWAATINQFQDPETGWYHKSHTLHYREHTTAYAVGALHLLARPPAHPLYWKEKILGSRRAMARWIKRPMWKAPWSIIWPGSHAISGVPAALAMTDEGTDEFFAFYFDWLDREADPASGFWRRGWLHKLRLFKRFRVPNLHDMAGAFHMYYIYEWFNRQWPYPERVVDHALRLQHANGLWDKDVTYCVDLDGLYCLTRSSRNAGSYRADDVEAAVRRYLATAHRTLTDRAFLLARYDNSHRLPGALSAVAECQKFFPALVHTPVPWPQSLDAACFI